MGLLLSIFFGFVPMFLYASLVYWLDRYEKEPKILLGFVFVWGAFVAAGVAFLINTFFGVSVYALTQSEGLTNITTGSLIAPVVEESLKGLAVLVVFLLFRAEFDSLLDGIVYAAVTALGFAATENAYYIYQYGYLEGGLSGLFTLTLVRVFLVGWQHPFYTAFIGIGIAMARLNRAPAIKALAPFAGWLIAVFLHALHNSITSLVSGTGGLIISTLVDWSGWLFMLGIIIWATFVERQIILTHLQEEVNLGIISTNQYRTAGSSGAQTVARLTSLLAGNYANTHRFYLACAELAHKKSQYRQFGDERGNIARIELLRAELGRLSPFVKP